MGIIKDTLEKLASKSLIKKSNRLDQSLNSLELYKSLYSAYPRGHEISKDKLKNIEVYISK